MDAKTTFAAAAAFLLSLGLCAVLNKIFIPVLRRVKLGQKILDIGPSWHKTKEGTPIMGGIFFIIPVLLVYAVASVVCGFDMRSLLLVAFALFNGLIGLIDDYVKLFKKQNQGLTAIQKLLLQFASVVALLATDAIVFGRGTAITIPFFHTYTVDIGIFYYIIMFLGAAYMVNCANLTDGIDGLAASVGLIISVMFTAFCIQLATPSVTFTAFAMCGALAGFLMFNHYPARVFMGDTGSLFIGALMVGFAFYFKAEAVILLAGIIWLIEGLSVVLQVLCFKLTKKRIFKMSPIHHHFELSGWSEVKIVVVFTFITAFLCAVAYLDRFLW